MSFSQKTSKIIERSIRKGKNICKYIYEKKNKKKWRVLALRAVIEASGLSLQRTN